ncbi:MAG: RNA-binding protein [Nannocystaceae bacterium]|nr:RNA-binding protein [Nannocystaceae bacterium]
MNNKLFVGGLSWNTTDQDLLDAFSPFGEVTDAKVITDRDTGRSRGFGFVTYSSDDSAARAMQEMDGATLDSRKIRVNAAEQRERGGGGGGPRGGGGGRFGGGGGGGGGRGGRDGDRYGDRDRGGRDDRFGRGGRR